MGLFQTYFFIFLSITKRAISRKSDDRNSCPNITLPFTTFTVDTEILNFHGVLNFQSVFERPYVFVNRVWMMFFGMVL
jgi:hypothetical protein